MAPLTIILGPTGAGKSYQAAQLATEYGWENISSGELLRQTHDAHIKAEMEAGELVDTVEVEHIVREALDRAGTQGIILDGFPREMAEATWLDALLPQINRTLERVIYLDVNKEVAIDRLLKRKRSDDTEVSLQHKWDWYETETKPVIEHYEKLGKLVRIDGTGSPVEVLELIHKAMQDEHAH